MTIVFLDLETGGLDPKKHPVTQIAAIAVDEALRELELFEAKVIFSVLEGTKEALNRQKYSPQRWAREARRADEVARDFAGFLRRHASIERIGESGKPYRLALCAGHNAAAFDGPFLQGWFKRLGLFCPIAFHLLDTMQRAAWFFAENPGVPPPESLKLGALCAYFGIALGDEAHDALADIRATVELYRLLCRPVRIAQVA
jgi:DNA polymerase III epsilon subunit-like protein